MDIFGDDAADRAPARDRTPRRPARRRPSRQNVRFQRVAAFAAILFVVVFSLAWWARSCQHSRKVDSYRTYFSGVSAAINDSAALGKQLDRIVANPTKLNRKELAAKLGELKAGQAEIAVRAGRLAAPEPLSGEQACFVEGMRVRAEGFRLFESTMLPILSNKKVSAQRLAALAGYFSGPDAYYTSRIYVQARNTMTDDGVSDVTVPTSTYFLTAKTFDRGRLAAMLTSMSSSTKLTGVHGVGLMSVKAQPGGTLLSASRTIDVPASADLSFVTRVQNQGDSPEENVAVTAVLTFADRSTNKQKATIGSIAAGKTGEVTLQGFVVPAEALGTVATLKVTAGPVPGEKVTSNNTATYKIALQL